MLFFELFPAFMTLLCVMVAVALYFANRRAAGEPSKPDTPPARRVPGVRPSA